jgi:hypothetical protein
MGAWLPRLSLSLLPLELLWLQLILAGCDPGPAPGLEIGLLWAVAVLLPQLRPPWALPLAVVRPIIALLQLPVLLWLDGRAGMAAGVSPFADQSRAAALFWSVLVLVAMQWQLRSALGTIAIEPEQRAADGDRQSLNPEVGEGDQLTAGGPQGHRGSADTSGREEGDPESAT